MTYRTIYLILLCKIVYISVVPFFPSITVVALKYCATSAYPDFLSFLCLSWLQPEYFAFSRAKLRIRVKYIVKLPAIFLIGFVIFFILFLFIYFHYLTKFWKVCVVDRTKMRILIRRFRNKLISD